MSNNKPVGLDKNRQQVLYNESQSLTNVLGFQAGGPNVVVPVQRNPWTIRDQNLEE
jgi:hypothetical protein